MVFIRKLLASAIFGVALAAAAPAAAQSNTAVAVGAIDASKVTAPEGEDSRFQQLFAKWEATDAGRPVNVPAPSVSLPSRNPLQGGALTSDYGMRTHPVLGGRRSHKGIDIAAPTGTPIYATADGLVSKAEPFSSYGNYVAIEHGASVQTRYAHMSRIAVAAGARVKKGDIIGYVGSTGRSTGPHLHYEVRVNGESVNPMLYMGSDSHRALALVSGTGGQGGDDEE